MMGKLFSTTVAKVLGGVTLALVIACGALLIWGNYWHGRAASWEDVAGKWKTAQQAQESAYVAAQAHAAAANRAARLATEETSRQLARKADDDATIADLRATAARYGDARRVPVHAAPLAGQSGGPGAAGQADAAPRGDGPGADAVVLGRGEYDQLVGNTLRLERVRRWGQSLVDAGLAVAQ